MGKKIPDREKIHTIIFDFDGVFTNNKVMVGQDEREYVHCDRSDGLALDFLRKFIEKNQWDLHCFILSTETNSVVSVRAKKLKLHCVQNVKNKAQYIQEYLQITQKNADGIIYLGNDLNDLSAMCITGFSIAPSDAHPKIQEHADLVMPNKGGDGFVRAFIEQLLDVEAMNVDKIMEYF